MKMSIVSGTVTFCSRSFNFSNLLRYSDWHLLTKTKPPRLFVTVVALKQHRPINQTWNTYTTKTQGSLKKLSNLGIVPKFTPFPISEQVLKKHSECSESHNKHLNKFFLMGMWWGGSSDTQNRKCISSSLYTFVSEMTLWKVWMHF